MYKPHLIKVELTKEPPVNPKRVEFRHRTTSSDDFPNWGKQKVNIEKRWDPPVRSTELPFKGNSSYRKSYQPSSKQEIEALKTDFTTTSAFMTSFSLAPRDKLMDTTTYSDTMKEYPQTILNTQIKVIPHKFHSKKAIPGVYRTTSNSFYDAKVPDNKDPRQIKYALLSKIVEKSINK